MAHVKQFCTFFVDGLFFGIDVQKVQEVIRYQEMTRVPLAPPAVSGLVNLRGQIVPALDLRLRLGLKAREPGVLPLNIVVRTDESAVSFLVDEIGDVLELEDDLYESPPETMPLTARESLLGVYKLRDRLLLILDTARAVDVAGSVDRK